MTRGAVSWPYRREMTDATTIQNSAAPQPSSGRRILRGGPAIARHLDPALRQTQRLLQRGEIPGFRLGKLWCTIPRTLDAYPKQLNDEVPRRALRRRK